jgi:hypothetical protein
MPPEQTQNPFFGKEQQQELADFTERARKDPSSVDPDKLERDYLQKLEQAARSRTLDDRGFRNYERAKNQIREAVQKLRQVRQFFADKLKIEVISKAAMTRGVESEKVDYSERIREETPGLEANAYTRQMVMCWDFAFLTNFINQPNSNLPEDMGHWMLDVKGRAIDARRNLALALSDHYREIFPAEIDKAAEKLDDELGRVRTGLSTFSMLDYTEIDNDLSDIEMYLQDRKELLAMEGRVGSGGPAFAMLRDPSLEAACAAAGKRVVALREELVAARQYMKPDERFALENLDRATHAVSRGDRGARGWEKAAWDWKLLIVTRQQAERNSLAALAFGNNPEGYQQGQAKMAEAARMEAKNMEAANRLYREADELFRGEARA